MAKNVRTALLVVALLFWGIRLAVLIQVVRSPLGQLHTWSEGDMAYYVEAAQRVAAGDLLLRDPPHPFHRWMASMGTPEAWENLYGNRQIYFMEPGYFYALGGLFPLTGPGPWSWTLAQQGLSFLTLLMVFHLAFRLGGLKPAVAAGALFCLYGPLTMYETVALRETLLVFLTLASVYLGALKKYPLAAGALAGILVMTKTFSALLLSLFLWNWGRSAKPIRNLLLYGLGAACLSLPFVLRNGLVGAPLLSFSTRGPVAFFVGNTSGIRPVLPDGSNAAAKGERFKAIVKAHGYRLWPVVRACMESHPSLRAYAAFNLKKLYYQFHGFEAWDNVNYYFFRGLVFPAGILLTFLPLLLLALPGLPVLLRDRSLGPAFLVMAGYVAAHAIFTAALARYRQDMVPLLCVAAGLGLIRWLEWVKVKKRLTAATWLGAVLLLGWLLSGTPAPRYRQTDFILYESALAQAPRIRPLPGYQKLKAVYLKEKQTLDDP